MHSDKEYHSYKITQDDLHVQVTKGEQKVIDTMLPETLRNDPMKQQLYIQLIIDDYDLKKRAEEGMQEILKKVPEAGGKKWIIMKLSFEIRERQIRFIISGDNSRHIFL